MPTLTARRSLPDGLLLKSGSHAPDSQMCVMEAVAYVAGEPWSDAPQCASPVITAFLRRWNDDLPNDETRTRLLLPLVPRLVESKGSVAIEEARVYLTVDWLRFVLDVQVCSMH